MRKVFTNLLLFLIGLLLFKQVLNRIVPASGMKSTIRYKNELLERIPANLLIFGNSSVKRGVIPAVIDSINQAKEIKTYNYGIHSLALPYTIEWAKTYLKDFPEVHTLVVELTGNGSKILDFDVWWPYVEPTVNFEDGSSEETVLFRRFRNFVLEEYFSPLSNLESIVAQDKKIIFENAYDGFVPYAEDVVKNERQKRPLDHANRSTGRAYNTGGMQYAEPLDPVYQQSIDELYEICLQAKVKLIFLAPAVMVSFNEIDHFRSATRYALKKGIPVLLPTNPELVSTSHRFDIRHFNQQGAQVYSEELGKALKGVLK